MKTRDLVIETLKKVGCQPEVDDKDNICFKYQGESLYVSADNNFKCWNQFHTFVGFTS